MKKQIDVLIAHCQSCRTLCSVTFMVSTILCVHTLIIMGFRLLRLKRLVLNSLFFSVYFIDIGPSWFYSILFPFLMSAAITTTNSDGSGGKVWFDFRYSNSLWFLLTVLQNHAASSAFFIAPFTLIGPIEYF